MRYLRRACLINGHRSCLLFRLADGRVACPRCWTHVTTTPTRRTA